MTYTLIIESIGPLTFLDVSGAFWQGWSGLFALMLGVSLGIMFVYYVVGMFWVSRKSDGRR